MDVSSSVSDAPRSPRPLLSIVTPTLRAAAHLSRCLESVAELSRRLPAGTIEHICVDGGSRDGTVELLKAHAARNRGLVGHLSSQRDSGQGDALNRGFFHARGRFGAWINADDWYEVDGAAAAVERLASMDADVLVGRARLVDGTGAVVWAPTPPEPLTLASVLRLRSMWFAGRNLVQPEVLFSMAAFRRVGGVPQDNAFSMDHELWCRLLAAGARFESIDALVAGQLWHAGQKTADRVGTVRAMVRSSRVMVERWGALLGGEGEAVRAEVEAMAAKLAVVERWLPAWRGERLSNGYREVRRPALPAVEDLLAEAGRAVVGGATDVVMEGVDGGAWSGPKAAVVLEGGSAARDGAERVDLCATVGVVARRGDAAIHAIVERLRPGGVWAQLGEPMPLVPEIGAWLATRATQRLAADSDEIVSPEADEALRAGRPGPGGVDVVEAVAASGVGLELVREGHFGAWSEHPATPFPRPEELADVFATWSWQLWRKPLRMS